MFVEVPGEKLVEGIFAPTILNRIKLDDSVRNSVNLDNQFFTHSVQSNIQYLCPKRINISDSFKFRFLSPCMFLSPFCHLYHFEFLSDNLKKDVLLYGNSLLNGSKKTLLGYMKNCGRLSGS